MLYIANWKCNLNSASIVKFLQSFNTLYDACNQKIARDNVIIAPPFPYITTLTSHHSEHFVVAAQNLTHLDNIKPTGEISGSMLKDLGVKHVIIGHSERRNHFNENSQILEKKIKNAIANDLGVIFCIGESYEERLAKTYLNTLSEQLKVIFNCYNSNNLNNLMIAYEPIWAIGSGKNASNDEISEILSFVITQMRSNFSDEFVRHVKFIYGGSVSPSNVSSLKQIDLLDGFLIGSASLDATSFCDILLS